MRFRLAIDGEAHEVEVRRISRAMVVRVDGAAYRAVTKAEDRDVEVRIGGHRHRVEFRGSVVRVDAQPHAIGTETLEPMAGPSEGRGPGLRKGTVEVRPPMPGRIVRVGISPGAHVKRGQTLVVLEAMKMQNEIPSPADAMIREVRVREGESIAADRIIAVLETS